MYTKHDRWERVKQTCIRSTPRKRNTLREPFAFRHGSGYRSQRETGKTPSASAFVSSTSESVRCSGSRTDANSKVFWDHVYMYQTRFNAWLSCWTEAVLRQLEWKVDFVYLLFEIMQGHDTIKHCFMGSQKCSKPVWEFITVPHVVLDELKELCLLGDAAGRTPHCCCAVYNPEQMPHFNQNKYVFWGDVM